VRANRELEIGRPLYPPSEGVVGPPAQRWRRRLLWRTIPFRIRTAAVAIRSNRQSAPCYGL
jgi:hypothetical protein